MKPRTITPLDALRGLTRAINAMQSSSDFLPGCRLRTLQRAKETANAVLEANGPIELPPHTFETLHAAAEAKGYSLERDLREGCFNLYTPEGHAFCVTLREVAGQIGE